MKKLLVPLSLSLCVMLGCEKTKELLTFDLDPSTEFTLPGFPLVIDTTISVTVPDVPTNSDKVFKDKGTSPDLIKDIKLAAMTLQTLNPSSQTFTFLKSIEFYISADGLTEQLLASKYNIPDNVGSTLELDATAQPLDDYIKKDKINLRIVVEADEALPQDTEIKADMIYQVTADPL